MHVRNDSIKTLKLKELYKKVQYQKFGNAYLGQLISNLNDRGSLCYGKTTSNSF